MTVSKKIFTLEGVLWNLSFCSQNAWIPRNIYVLVKYPHKHWLSLSLPSPSLSAKRSVKYRYEIQTNTQSFASWSMASPSTSFLICWLVWLVWVLFWWMTYSSLVLTNPPVTPKLCFCCCVTLNCWSYLLWLTLSQASLFIHADGAITHF